MALPPGFIGSSGKHVIIGGSCYQFVGNEDFKSSDNRRGIPGDMILIRRKPGGWGGAGIVKLHVVCTFLNMAKLVTCVPGILSSETTSNPNRW